MWNMIKGCIFGFVVLVAFMFMALFFNEKDTHDRLVRRHRCVQKDWYQTVDKLSKAHERIKVLEIENRVYKEVLDEFAKDYWNY